MSASIVLAWSLALLHLPAFRLAVLPFRRTPLSAAVRRPSRARLLAVAAAAGIAPLAAAQVTVFGVIDTGVTVQRGDGAATQKNVDGDGNTSSRFGLRGQEDLGGGFKAAFWIESAVNPDTGTSGATSTNNKDSVNSGGLTWGRRATVGLVSRWGELRLGRDYVPSFGNLNATMHPFGTNGVGSAGHLFYPANAGGTTVRTHVRASNSVGYHVPDNAAGVYGALMVATGEQPGGAATSDDGDLHGARLGWRGGAWNVSAAASKTSYATGRYLQRNVAGNVQWGPAKLMALWGENEVGATRTRAVMLGTQWSVGTAGEVRLAYTRLKATGVASDASHVAVGYVHDLSKRTALYATWARIDNDGTGTRFNTGVAPRTPGGSSSGADLGLKHAF